ncbi:winged helix-turn-helix domain-containing protein [Kocuria flava]|uniref:BTAD domain-containing putative transcriptional regulator n=1 Tax=Kocuria flava TaxID=446860 RepID=UPI001FF6D4A1|nr:BTAD domain-containing putative transcriptional regulator [Kocuria flava]MCJ8505884.1 winged helix-turn-helix domain-containing protein [Kocuria flava]
MVDLTGNGAPVGLKDLAYAMGRADGPLCLIIDDLHVLVGTGAEAELKELLRLSPPSVHLLAGSRCAPAFNLACSELSTTVVVDADSLRFRVPETYELFRDVHCRPLDPSGALDLTLRTDGWAAALHLFDLSVRTRTPVERRRAAGTGTTRYIRDYLVRHLLEGTPEQGLDLLRLTCPLDVLTPALCDAVTGSPETAQPLLRDLERRGLVVDCDDGFRVPVMLREFLADGPAAHGSAQRAAVRRRAAEVLEREGASEGALRIFAEDGDWNAVELVLRRAGGAAFAAGACSWAALLPEQLRRDSPWCSLASARRLLDDGRLREAADAASRALELAHGSMDFAPAHEVVAFAAAWTAPAAEAAGNGPLRAATRCMPEAAAGLLGETPRDADLLGAGLAWVLAGNQCRALPLLRRCAADIARRPFAALAAQLALSLLEADCSLADPFAAAAEAEAVARGAHRRGFTWLARLAHGTFAALEGTPGGEEIVAAILQECDRLGDDWGAALLSGVSVFLRSCGCGTAPGDDEFDVLAHRFRALGAGALEAWVRSLQAMTSTSAQLPSAEEDVRSAEAFARAAQVPGALAVSYAAMAAHYPDRSGELWRLADVTAEDAGFIPRPRAWKAPEPREAPRHEPTVARLGTAPAETPDLVVSCFGEFSLHLGGSVADLSDVRPLARTVLRMLALHAGRPVHREQLVAALWGDLDADRALHNLQVSISSLRRTLGTQGACDGRALLARQGECYVLCLGGDGSRSDLLEFDRSLQQASRARRLQDTHRVAENLRRAVELYTEDVLPEDGPAEWVVDSRDQYRLRAADAASTLARAELSLGRRDAAVAAVTRSVEINPWSDESWRLLIDVLRDGGDLTAAGWAHRRYRDMLASLGLDAELVGREPGDPFTAARP